MVAPGVSRKDGLPRQPAPRASKRYDQALGVKQRIDVRARLGILVANQLVSAEAGEHFDLDDRYTAPVDGQDDIGPVGRVDCDLAVDRQCRWVMAKAQHCANRCRVRSDENRKQVRPVCLVPRGSAKLRTGGFICALPPWCTSCGCAAWTHDILPPKKTPTTRTGKEEAPPRPPRHPPTIGTVHHSWVNCGDHVRAHGHDMHVNMLGAAPYLEATSPTHTMRQKSTSIWADDAIVPVTIN